MWINRIIVIFKFGVDTFVRLLDYCISNSNLDDYIQNLLKLPIRLLDCVVLCCVLYAFFISNECIIEVMSWCVEIKMYVCVYLYDYIFEYFTFYAKISWWPRTRQCALKAVFYVLWCFSFISLSTLHMSWLIFKSITRISLLHILKHMFLNKMVITWHTLTHKITCAPRRLNDIIQCDIFFSLQRR